jgi:hypothetical protein
MVDHKGYDEPEGREPGRRAFTVAMLAMALVTVALIAFLIYGLVHWRYPDCPAARFCRF